MTILRVLLAATVMLTAGRQGVPAVEPGFTSLFNGTDLTGWKTVGPVESFSVKDGAIVANANGAPSHAYYDGPIGNHAFRNFELKVDVMTRKGSNGGIYVLTEYEPNPANVRASGRPGHRITGPGTIALQAHDPNSTVYYKNIRIKPLD